MAQVNKIDSNATELRYSEETAIGVADASADWIPVEPNGYSDFGGQVTNVARSPILSDRQNKKGVLTDLEASGGFSADLTQEALPDLAQGMFVADSRKKDELVPTAVTVTIDTYTVPALGTNYVLGDVLFASGFDLAANNGKKTVASSTGTTVVVDQALATETPSGSPFIRRVGFTNLTAELDVTINGDGNPVLTSTLSKDPTDYGLIPGEWIWIGGDTATSDFVNAENNGFKRVLEVTATEIILDKSDSTMIAETGTGLLIELYFPSRLVKNEDDPTLQVRRTYQLERTLGAPDDASPAQIQSEYLVGAVPSQLQLNIATADKLTFDLSFMGLDVEQRTGVVGLKASATRPDIIESEAYNSSSDVKRINMSTVTAGVEAPTALFGFIQELSITIDNNLSVNKAVGTLGGFDVTLGRFSVSGTLTAYFDNISAMESIRANDDITIDAHNVKANQGISIDLPLVTIGDGRPNVESDAAITLPISFEAATGAKVDSTLNHTAMIMFWDYLPDVAEA
jgi:hypothetical protein